MAKSKTATAVPGRYRTITNVALTTAGTGYLVNNLVYVNVPKLSIRCVLIITSVGGGGAVTGATILSGGLYPTNTSGIYACRNITGTGTGFAVTVTTALIAR